MREMNNYLPQMDHLGGWKDGRNTHDGMQRGWGLAFGDLRTRVGADPDFTQAVAPLRGRMIASEDKIKNIFLIFKFYLPKMPIGDIVDISITKLAGLWATWAIIGGLYCIARWYWRGQYLFSMEVLGAAAIPMFILSIPYVVWLDRVLGNPRDGAWHFGAMLIGREPFDGARDRIADLVRQEERRKGARLGSVHCGVPAACREHVDQVFDLVRHSGPTTGSVPRRGCRPACAAPRRASATTLVRMISP